MSAHNISWFHCGRCGSLFQSKPGDSEDRLCTKCGANPSPVILETPAALVTPASPAEETASPLPRRSRQHGKRAQTTRSHRFFTLKLIAGWSALLVIIILGARKIWYVTPPETPAARASTKADAPPLSEEELVFLSNAGNRCAETFSAFLAAGTPEERNQFVLSPVTTASRMARFDSLNPMTAINPQSLSPTGTSIIKQPDAKAIETHWSSKDGRTIDAVFREENGEWRLDWDHFARYSDYPWALFLAGSGPPEGEFRLLARERLAEERKNSPTISLVLYAPRFGAPAETGFQSPEFLVERVSPEGKLLDAAFKLARSGKQIYGSKLPSLNPDDMIRVRVNIKRTEVDMERKFEITRVIACHWYSVDDPGVEPSEPAPAEEQDQER